MNVYFLHIQGSDFSDESLSAKWLTYHSDLNPQLYAHQTSIRTVIASNKLIPEAYADSIVPSFIAFGNDINDDSIQTDIDDAMISDNTIVKSNPDSIAQLITQQFKVHTVATGESLRSISKQYNVSENTLIWTNKLSDFTIQPGWELLIPPTDGVIAQIEANTSVSSLAKKYNVDKATIMAYNGLGNETVEAGSSIMIPGGKIIVPKPVTPKTNAAGKYVSSLTPGSHLFPEGYCTWYVATRMEIPWSGHAYQWPTKARDFGAILTSKPTQGAIVVTTDSSKYGHVGLVEEVFADGTFTISEMNYKAFAVVNKRTLHVGDKKIRTFIVYNK